METKIRTCIDQKIDAYVNKTRAMIFSNNTKIILPYCNQTLNLYLLGRFCFCKRDTAKAFSSMLGRKISDDDIVKLNGKPDRLPDVPSFAYNLDVRGWIFVNEGERDVFFVDATLHHFDPIEGELVISNSWKYYLLGAMIAGIIVGLAVFFFPN